MQKEFAKQRFLRIDIGLQPEVLRSFIGSDSGELPESLQHLVHDSDHSCNWHLGTTTPVMQHITQQILQCPHQSIPRRMDLEGKVLQLLALLVDQEIELQTGQRSPSPPLRPDQIDRLHHAREILLRQLDNPPSLMQLAHQVNLNEFMLKQFFRQVFGESVFAYLHRYRMEQAQQLLAMGHLKVEEVGRMVGYRDRSAFTKAFRRRFDMSPSDYRQSFQSD